MAQLFSNNGISSLASGITAGATALTFATGEGAKFTAPTGGDFELLTLYDDTSIDVSANVEIVKMTARAADVATIVRGQEGTSGFAFSATDGIEAIDTAGTLDALKEGRAGLLQDVTEKVHTAASVDIDPANGNVQVRTLAGNETFTFTNIDPGQSVLIKIIPGANTLTLTNVAKWDNGGAAPSSIEAEHWIIVSNIDGTIVGTDRGGVS
jgi:hypothetical protein